MQIKLNGEAHDIKEGMRLPQLLEELGIDSQNLAVEHNGDFLDDEQQKSLIVNDGDTLEIVRFVGGG